MECMMYQQGKCTKQPIGSVSVGFFVRRTSIIFRDCSFDGRVWQNGRAFEGRAEDSNKRHEDCSMFEGGNRNDAS